MARSTAGSDTTITFGATELIVVRVVSAGAESSGLTPTGTWPDPALPAWIVQSISANLR